MRFAGCILHSSFLNSRRREVVSSCGMPDFRSLGDFGSLAHRCRPFSNSSEALSRPELATTIPSPAVQTPQVASAIPNIANSRASETISRGVETSRRRRLPSGTQRSTPRLSIDPSLGPGNRLASAGRVQDSAGCRLAGEKNVSAAVFDISTAQEIVSTAQVAVSPTPEASLPQ